MKRTLTGGNEEYYHDERVGKSDVIEFLNDLQDALELLDEKSDGYAEFKRIIDEQIEYWFEEPREEFNGQLFTIPPVIRSAH